MAEKPILFNTEMVKAILEGRKTQTRRVIKPQPSGVMKWHPVIERWSVEKTGELYKAKYGQPGDSLWVRETCKLFSISGVDGSTTNPEMWTIRYRAGGGIKTVPKQSEKWGSFDRWTPSIHMPRWVSRLTLRVEDVRVERLQEASLEDIISEGCPIEHLPENCNGMSHAVFGWFSHLWDSINAKRGYSWQSNPWVWVVEFPKEQNYAMAK